MSEKKKKFKFLRLIVAIFITPVLWWFIFGGGVSEELKEQIQKNNKCVEKTIFVKIDGVEVVVPRTALLYKNNSENNEAFHGKCDVKIVDNVNKAFWTEGAEVVRVFGRDNPMSLGTFEAAKKHLKPFETIEYGVEKAEGETLYDYYRILPDVLGGGYKDPILVSCDSFDPENISIFADCRWYYDHPSGVGFGHKIWLKNYPGKSILEIFKLHEQRDQERINLLNK